MALRQHHPTAYVCCAGVLLSLWAWAAAPALAQSGACILSPANADSVRYRPNHMAGPINRQ
jgi:hypothetical protein